MRVYGSHCRCWGQTVTNAVTKYAVTSMLPQRILSKLYCHKLCCHKVYCHTRACAGMGFAAWQESLRVHQVEQVCMALMVAGRILSQTRCHKYTVTNCTVTNYAVTKYTVTRVRALEMARCMAESHTTTRAGAVCMHGTDGRCCHKLSVTNRTVTNCTTANWRCHKYVSHARAEMYVRRRVSGSSTRAGGCVCMALMVVGQR